MSSQSPQPPKISRWLNRLQAIGFGFLLLLLIELTCLFFGFGKKELDNDPFVGFSALEPLFALNPLNNRYETRPERISYFLEDSFFRKKSSDTFRIFVFGGSTVQGRPYALETAFPKWLQINLKAAFPNKEFEVVNCGGISYASYRLVPIIEECLAYEPDLFILCTGQNEFLEARTYGPLKQLAKQFGGPVKVIRELATYQAMDTLYHRLGGSGPDYTSPKKPTMKMEVDAFLDYRRGLEAYHRDREWRQGVIAHFQENFRRIHTISQNADIPLLVLNPPVNLKDSPPFKSEQGKGITDAQKVAYEDWITQANDHYQTDVRKAAQYLQWAIELDPEYALTHYSLGQCYLALGEFAKARSSFLAALEEDVCPLRILPSMRQFVFKFSNLNKLPYLDLQALLKQHSEEPVIGSEILIDHVHPTIRGHQIIAQAIAELLFETFLDDPVAQDWKSTRATAYQTHFNSLDGLYYSRGNLRLENLRLWTKGQTEGPPIEMHVPIEPR
jgi:lysophospholipase L1-like esterase